MLREPLLERSMHCRSCQAPITATHRFCPACGELYPGQAALLGAGTTPLADLAAEIQPLVREKAQLGAELQSLAVEGRERELTADERRRWEQAYMRWRDVASEIDLLVDRVHPRAETERRGRHAPNQPTVERRSQGDRRDPFWGQAP